jgi:hypothetical protein
MPALRRHFALLLKTKVAAKQPACLNDQGEGL